MRVTVQVKSRVVFCLDIVCVSAQPFVSLCVCVSVYVSLCVCVCLRACVRVCCSCLSLFFSVGVLH